MSHNQLLSREDVINAYKFILGRAPESEQVIDEHRGYTGPSTSCVPRS